MPRRKKTITLADYPKWARKKFREIFNLYGYQTIRELLLILIELLNELIIEEGERTFIPGAMGSIHIRFKKTRLVTTENGFVVSHPVNWKETNALWARRPELRRKQYVYYTMENTGGYKAKCYWRKYGCRKTNRTLYRFRFTKPNRTRIKDAINSGTEYDYFEEKVK